MSQGMGTTADALLAHADWMRALAVRLVRDPDRADDVVQQSFVAALERPPRHAENVRGWLGRVVTNRARQMGRTDLRRERREHARHEDEALPSAEELAVEAELQRTIVSAILELDEPYRSTVLLRFYRDLTPKEIAAHQGVPAATVRSRLRRALGMLREELDRKHDGDRAAWSALLVPLARVSAVAALGVKVKLASTAAVVALVAWIGVTAAPPRSPVPAEIAPVPMADGDEDLAEVTFEDVEPEVVRTSVAVDGEDETEEPALAALTGRYLGTVSDPAGAPVSGARLRVFPKERGNWHELEPLAVATTGSDGRFEIPVPPELTSDRVLLLEASAPGHGSLSLDPLVPERAVNVTLEWRTDLIGRVVDSETDAPLAGVRISKEGEEAVSGLDGTFRLSGLRVGSTTRLQIMGDGYATTEIELTAPTRAPVERTFGLSPGKLLRITVVDRDTDAPLPGAVLSHYHGPQLGEADTDGVVEVRIEPSSKLDLQITLAGYAHWTWHFDELDESAPSEPVVRLVRYGVIHGTLTGPDGDALAGAYLYASNDEDRGFGRHRVEDDLPGSAFDRIERGINGPTDDDGRFMIHVLPSDAPFTVRGGSQEYVSIDHGPVAVREGGQRVLVDLAQRAGGTVRGRVLYNGEALSYARVLCKSASGEVTASRVDADGSYRIDSVPVGDAELTLRDDMRLATDVPEPLQITVGVGAEVLHDFILNSELEPIRGVVVEANGQPAADVFLSATQYSASGFVHAQSKTDAAGRFELSTAPGDPYTVRAFRDRGLSVSEEIAPGTEDVELVLPAAGAIHVRLVDAATGELILPTGSQLWRIAWRPTGEDAFKDFRDTDVVEGVIRLVVPLREEAETADLEVTMTEEGYAPYRAHGISIARADESPRVLDIELQRGLSCKLKLVGEEPLTLEQRTGRLVFALHEDEEGALRGPFPQQGGPSNQRINGVNMWIGSPGLLHRLVDFEDDRTATLTGLAPGRYSLAVFPDELAFEPATFEVTQDGTTMGLDWAPR
ncbi:MAG: sigma-70 family RNA polymerase sigma factor [Planctomycetota bacterium]